MCANWMYIMFYVVYVGHIIWNVAFSYATTLINLLIYLHADDTNLVVPEHTESILTEEFIHFCDWVLQKADARI